MKLIYDPVKSERNLEERGLSFERVMELDWKHAITWIDDRSDYRETRYCGLALLDKRLHAVTWTARGSAIRVISFRKANARERKRYEKEKA
jgi:uncharacterized DUF497 family protein